MRKDHESILGCYCREGITEITSLPHVHKVIVLISPPETVGGSLGLILLKVGPENEISKVWVTLAWPVAALTSMCVQKARGWKSGFYGMHISRSPSPQIPTWQLIWGFVMWQVRLCNTHTYQPGLKISAHEEVPDQDCMFFLKRGYFPIHEGRRQMNISECRLGLRLVQ